MAEHGQHKIGKVMEEFKEGKLHSGSGGKVTSRKQALAIAISEARKAGARIPKKRKKKSSGRSFSKEHIAIARKMMG